MPPQLRSGIVLCWIFACILPVSCTRRAPVVRNRPLQVPKHFDTGIHPGFPAARYITGTGRSLISLKDAKTKAQSEVSSKIQSSILSIFQNATKLIQQKIGNQKLKRRYKRISNDIVVKTRFSHNELIEIGDQLHDKSRKVFHAFAVLERKKAGTVLKAELTRVLGAFDILYEDCLRAHREMDLLRIIGLLKKLKSQTNLSEPRLLEYAVVSGKISEFGRLTTVRRLLKVMGMKGDLDRRVEWIVHASNRARGRTYSARALGRALVGTLTRFGLNVSNSSKYWPGRGVRWITPAQFGKLRQRINPAGKILLNGDVSTSLSKAHMILCESSLTLSAYDLGTRKYLFNFHIPGRKEGDLTPKKAMSICLKGLVPKAAMKLLSTMKRKGFRER